jgi:hypothetical protein
MKIGIGTRINHPQFGEGVVCAIRHRHYNISFIGKGPTEIDKDFEGLEIIEFADEDARVSVDDVKSILEDLLINSGAIQPTLAIGDKWRKGTMTLKPYDSSLSSKDISIEDFFHKIVMLRDRLRVLEQKINSNTKLEDAEKVDIQQYITRCYGSLTTFNILFKFKEDQFVGQKGE